MKNDCIYIPRVKKADGTEAPSILYRELNKNKNLRGQRPLVNYIYAQYLSGGDTAMDAAGYTEKDVNGEHLWQDVYKFFEISDILNTQVDERNIQQAKISIGAIDDNGNTIYYANGKEALDKVVDFNSKNKALVAKVTKDGNQYVITVENKNSGTQWQEGKSEEQFKLFQSASEVFKASGYDLEQLALQFPELFSITNMEDTIDFLKSFTLTNIGQSTQKEVEFLLTILGPENPQVKRITEKWGSIPEAAKVIYESFKGNTKLTIGEQSLVATALNKAKEFNGLDFSALQKQLNQESKSYKNASTSFQISTILKEFRDKYGIDDRGIFVVDKKIRSFAQAAGNAAIILNRRLRELEKKQGITPESKQLQNSINVLLREIDSNRYYQGLLTFTSEAAKHIKEVNDSLRNVQGTKGSQEYVKNLAEAIIKGKRILNAYQEVLEPLSRADTFTKEDNISSDNVKNIMQIAYALNKEIQMLKEGNKEIQGIDGLEKGVIIDILSEWLGWGKTLPNGVEVSSLVNMLTDDISFIENLYSACRSGNPLLAAMGTITRDAQTSRNNTMIEYNNRIAKATEKLKKAGYTDTKWMYDREGRIINPYDWKEFGKQYHRAVKELQDTGLKGIDFKIALQYIINGELTQEVVVDTKSGRTERLPVFMKKVNPLNSLSDAQLEYYNEVMQIKGEFGTMMPDYARNQYLPPQVRSNSVLDAKNIKDAFRRLGSNIKDAFRITENDIDNMGNLTFADTTEEGDTIISVEGNYDDTVAKDIPIYHVRKLKDQSKLVTDFSGALQQLGASAINYKAMSEIESTALLIEDFLSEQREAERNGENTIKADTVESRTTLYAKKLGRFFKSTNTLHIAEGYIDREFYGVKMKDKPRLAKVVQTLLNYTRFKQLSTNVLGGTSNYLVGEYQIILEAIGKDNFDLKDYTWANATLFGDNTIKAPGRIIDYLSNNITELNTLIGNFFDPLQESFDELGHKRYNRAVRNLLELDYSGAVYGIGEKLIHYTVMYAMLNHEKVFIKDSEGKLKKVSLYEAFDKTGTVDGNAELKLKDGVRLIEHDSEGNEVEGRKITDLNDPYLSAYRDKIRYVNQECHGAMNTEDRGIISQRLLGRMVMQFRQWMVEHFSRRYREMHWDGSYKQWTEGWWVTAAKFLGRSEDSWTKWSWKSRLKTIELTNIINDYQKELQNRTLSDDTFNSLQQQAKFAKKQLKNLKIATTEFIAVAIITLLSSLWWVFDEDEDNPLLRFLMYQLKRLRTDAFAGTPVGIPIEAYTIAERPWAALKTMKGLFYPIFGLSDIGETYETGMHSGENKYLVRLGRLLPLYKDIENYQKMVDREHKRWHEMTVPYDLDRSVAQ